MDEVKISVGGEGEAKKPKKRGRPKKTTSKAAPAKKTVAEKKTSEKTTTKAVNKEAKPKSSSKGGSVLSTIIAVVVTAVIVGGSIYAWQSKNSDSAINDVKQDARKVRMDFEQRMEQLKNKLTGVENENQELKNTAKELEERVKLLDGAKKDFENTDLGLRFEYPALFGEINLQFTDGVSGKKFVGTFSKNDTLTFGGVSKDYQPEASSTKVDFLETTGVYENKDELYFQTIGSNDSREYGFRAIKEIKAENTSVYLVDKTSFEAEPSEDAEPTEEINNSSIEIGDDIGAILNLDKENYQGISFLNKDIANLPLESYENMLASIEITN